MLWQPTLGGIMQPRDHWRRPQTTVGDPPSVLLLHCEGTNGSTTFTDSSASAHTVVSGGAQISTAQFKFGSASGLWNGTTNYMVLDGSSDFAFGTGDFTIDCQLRFNSITGNQNIIQSSPPATVGSYRLRKVTTTNVFDWTVFNTSIVITSTTVPVTNQWYHVALTRSGTSTRFFLDGVQEGSTYTDTNNYAVNATRPVIGASDGLTTNLFNGWIDEFRILKGTAAWTSNFTPPSAPYTA